MGEVKRMKIMLKTLFPGDELSPAFAIRKRVFCEEQGFHPALEFDGRDEICHHVLLLADGEPAGAGRVLAEPGGRFTLGRIALLPEFRKQGLGRVLVFAMMDLARELGARTLHVGAQLQARGFYEKLGFTATGREYLDEHCPHCEMEQAVKSSARVNV